MNRKRTLNNQILLSVVALLVICVLSVSITFSWIEGGTTYSMQTENAGDVKTESTLKNVDYNGTITLNPSSTQEINLFEYDNTTNEHQSIYFSPVSSKDGKNFYFPINMSGQTPAYRVATTNDIGTKYVSFDFDVKATKKCFIAFNSAPTITATKSGATVADTSAFRIMISDGTTAGTHIFSTGGAVSGSVVQSISGTSPTMTSFTTEAFTNYLNKTDKTGRLFSYDKNATGNIQVSIWIDSATATTDILGSDISISLDLIAVADDVEATFNAITYNRSGTKETNGFTGGSITYNSTSYTSSFKATGTTFEATAVANDGYEFQGWYTDAACTKSVSTTTALSHTPDDDITYYAKFQEISITTIYVETRSGFSTHYLYVYGEDNSYYSSAWPGTEAETEAEYDSTTGYYKFKFKTTDIGSFFAIVSDNGSNQYPAQNVEGLEGTLGGTYLFRADNTLIEFDPADMITFKAQATPSTYGTAYVNGVSSVKILSGDSVKLTANAVSGYRFIGWYKNSTCTTTIGSTYATANQTITVTGTAGSTITYYAKFEKIPVLTVKTSVTPSGGGTATVNSTSSVSVQTGTSVTLKATPASGYEFVGWYTNSACTTTIGTNYTTASTTYTVSGTDGATVTLYAKFKVEDTTRTIYFKPTDDWKSASAKFACYVWGNGTKWYEMSDTDGDGIYSATIDKSYTDIIFSRFDPKVTSYSFDTDWNQSADLTIPTDGKNLLTLGSGWTGATGTWSTYTP